MAYDRDAALAYARAHWNRPADDGFVAGEFAGKDFIVAPDDARFVHDFAGDRPLASEHLLLPDGTRWEWAALDDCTHFISCCLGEPGGGLTLPRDFADGPYGILGADRLTRHLIEAELVEPFAVADKRAPGLERIAPGDLVGYSSRQRGRFVHLAIYLGDGRIACHTYCRSDDPACTWDNVFSLGADDDNWRWTLLRFR
jgi:hypothetical protein